VLRMADDAYAVQVYRTQGDSNTLTLISEATPTINGAVLTEIPFIFHGVTQNTCSIEKPPLLDLVDINYGDYQNSADLENGRHFCGAPMPYVFGIEDTDALTFGSSEAWTHPNENAKAGMVEFTGQGLGALEKAREEKRIEMALLGGRLLEEQKKVGETAQAIALRQTGKASVLQNMAIVQSAGHAKALEWFTAWAGGNADDVTVALNTDFMAGKMAADALRELIAAWQGGAISHETLFWNMKQGEIIPDGRTFEDEVAVIKETAPTMDFGEV